MRSDHREMRKPRPYDMPFVTVVALAHLVFRSTEERHTASLTLHRCFRSLQV